MNSVVYFADNRNISRWFYFILFILNRAIKRNLDLQDTISWSMLKFHTQKRNNLSFIRRISFTVFSINRGSRYNWNIFSYIPISQWSIEFIYLIKDCIFHSHLMYSPVVFLLENIYHQLIFLISQFLAGWQSVSLQFGLSRRYMMHRN